MMVMEATWGTSMMETSVVVRVSMEVNISLLSSNKSSMISIITVRDRTVGLNSRSTLVDLKSASPVAAEERKVCMWF